MIMIIMITIIMIILLCSSDFRPPPRAARADANWGRERLRSGGARG